MTGAGERLPGTPAQIAALKIPTPAMPSQCLSAFGGVFYLLNLALSLQLYGDFTQPRRPGIALPVWDWLALLGQKLLGDKLLSDPLWPLLAQLAGLQFDAPADQLAATTTSFTYSVSDGTVTVNAGTTINVTPVNDAPIASSSTISVAEESVNTPLGLTVPTDVDGNALTITVTGLPAVGTVTLADGTPVTKGQVLTAAQLAGLQFDAPADQLAAATTSFSYSVSDGTTTVNAGTTINVTPVNDAPVAQASSFTVAEDAAVVNGAVTATDVDAGATLTFALNGTAPAGLTFNTSTGNVDVAPGTPAGTYSFDYQICEALNPTNCQIATITVTVVAAAG